MKPAYASAHHRRYRSYDYDRGAVVFATVVTEPRRRLFGRVVEGRMALSALGERVAAALQSQRTEGVALHEWVVMPDHAHFLLHLKPGQREPLRALGSFVGGFKSYTTRLYWEMAHEEARTTEGARPGLSAGAGRNPGRTPPVVCAIADTLWQAGYHDWLCISRRFIESCRAYIAYNPLKYELQHNRPEALRIREPLDSPLLADGEYWKGVGATGLLDPQARLLAVRISRRVDTAAAIAAAVARILRGVDAGFIPVCGFVSPGERALRDALIALPGARFIQVEVEAMPVDYRPASPLLPALQEGRLLLLGRPEATDLFDRVACLALNASILALARRSAGGMGCYARLGPNGLVWHSEGQS